MRDKLRAADKILTESDADYTVDPAIIPSFGQADIDLPQAILPAGLRDKVTSQSWDYFYFFFSIQMFHTVFHMSGMQSSALYYSPGLEGGVLYSQIQGCNVRCHFLNIPAAMFINCLKMNPKWFKKKKKEVMFVIYLTQPWPSGISFNTWGTESGRENILFG